MGKKTGREEYIWTFERSYSRLATVR